MFGFVLLVIISSLAFTESARPTLIQIRDDLKSIKDSNADKWCTSWRVAEEANNLLPWKKIPDECGDYVQKYMTGKGYLRDLETVTGQAVAYARSLNLSGDGKSVWIFDVDETLLSNLPYYAQHGFGLELFDPVTFDEWTEEGTAPSILPSLRLYNEISRLGIKPVLLTGRSEKYRDVTAQNLHLAGYRNWHRLLLRVPEESGKLATRYKSDRRKGLIEEGYKIVGNSGDQWSDLLDSYMANRSFKLPNPMYFIS